MPKQFGSAKAVELSEMMMFEVDKVDELLGIPPQDRKDEKFVLVMEGSLPRRT
jgi:hypothetical protein